MDIIGFVGSLWLQMSDVLNIYFIYGILYGQK